MSIELLDPCKLIERVHPELWQDAGWSYALDYSWIIQQCAAHPVRPPAGMRYIADAGCGVAPFSPLGGFIAAMLGVDCVGIDRDLGRPFEEFSPAALPEIIFWASSLEHNIAEKMRKLYLRSMELLPPGGFFLATITIARTTHWFDPSLNTNLTCEDAAQMFDEPQMIGDYDDVWEAYRQDQGMMAKYGARYGHFDENDPLFIIAGVKKVKA